MNPTTKNAKNLTCEEDRLKVLALRRQGLPYQKISEMFDRPGNWSWKIVKKEMLRLAAKMEVETKILRQLDLQRLDELQSALWLKASNGEIRAVEAVLKIIERRARIAGYELLGMASEEADKERVMFVIHEEGNESEWARKSRAEQERKAG